MSLAKVPIIASSLSVWELGRSLINFSSGPSPRRCFKRELAHYFKERHVFLTSSGSGCLYGLLKALKKISSKEEVILPAFTAHSLGAAINKAGLKVRLVDISLETFNLDIEKLPEALSRDILAIIPVHMFGLACDIRRIAELIEGQGIFLVEDFAQSMGTTVKGEETGTVSEIAFTSFGRGKNLPTYSGGMLCLREAGISRLLEAELNKLNSPGWLERLSTLFKLTAFTLVSNSYLYGCFGRFIRLGKELGADFQNKGYTDFQAKVGLHLLKKFEAIKDTKKKNGALLYAGLNGLRGISLPRILEGSKPVFNRFPVLFESLDKKRLVSRRLNSQGIEALPLYDKPLHKIYPELNRSSKGDEFPRATYFAEHHLCLPAHSLVTTEDIARILRIFRESL